MEPLNQAKSKQPGWGAKTARMAAFAVLLLGVLEVYLVPLRELSHALGDAIQFHSSFELARFFERNDSSLQQARNRFFDGMRDRFVQTVTAGELAHPPRLMSVELSLTPSPDGLRCQYKVVGPSSLIEDLRASLYPVEEGVPDLLGAVVVNGRRLRFEDLSIEPADPGMSTLRVDAERLRDKWLYEVTFPWPPKTRHLHFSEKRISVVGGKLLSIGNAETVERTATTAVFRLKEPGSDLPSLMVESATALGRDEEPLFRLVERSGLLNLPVLGSLGGGLLACVPLILLFLLLAREHLSEQERRPLCVSVGLVLGLRAGIAVLASVRIDLEAATRTFPWLADWLTRATGYSPASHVLYSQANPILVVLLAGVLWPVLGRRFATHRGALSGRRRQASVVLALVLTLLLPVGWITMSLTGKLSSPAMGMLCWLTALCSVYFWLFWELFSAWRALSSALVGAIATTALATAVSFPNYLSSTGFYRIFLQGMTVGIVMLLGAPMVVAFLRVASPLVGSARLKDFLQRPWLVWLGAIAICFPGGWLIDGSQMHWTVLWSLAFRLTDLFVFALLFVLLDILKQTSSDDPGAPHAEKAIEAGVVLALTFFYSSTSIWFYFPIPLILGYVLLRFLLFVPPEKPSLAAAARNRWPGLARDALRVRQLERTLSTVRKGLEAKLAKGKLTWAEYQSRLEPISSTVDTGKEALKVDGQSIAPLLFAGGPNTPAWQAGRKATVYSVLFAMPWILLSLRDVLKGHASESYVLLSFLNSAMMVGARWSLYGFFFGYFYPRIRGRNGLQKALAFWFTLVVPAVVASLLSSALTRESIWGLLFWMIQVFVHCVLLGLFAGELESLWKAGMSWRQLLDFHNLGALSAWGSSLLVALGAAITAALSTSLGQLVTTGLKYAGVLPPGSTP